MTKRAPFYRGAGYAGPNHPLWKAEGEHALLLKCEGLTYRAIGERMGMSRDRAFKRVLRGARLLAKATRRTKFRWPK